MDIVVTIEGRKLFIMHLQSYDLKWTFLLHNKLFLIPVFFFSPEEASAFTVTITRIRILSRQNTHYLA